jgi:hypothetical protein
MLPCYMASLTQLLLWHHKVHLIWAPRASTAIFDVAFPSYCYCASFFSPRLYVACWNLPKYSNIRSTFSRILQIDPSRELQILVCPIWKCCLYKEYGYLSNRTEQFCIIHIFKGNYFMQRCFCHCKMCLNIRMDKCNNLLCTLCVFLMVFTRLKLRWVHLQC